MLALYTEPAPFESFCDDDLFKNWRELIASNIDVYINLSAEELEKEREKLDSPLTLFYLSIASGNDPIAKDEYIANVIDDNSLLKGHPFDMFILDISSEEAKNLKEGYGLEIFAQSELKDDLNDCVINCQIKLPDDFIYEKRPFKPKNENNVGKEWEKLMLGFKNQISNATIIVDRNLFTNKDGKQNRGILNIVKYFDTVLQEKLLIPYQILIITEFGKFSDEKIRSELIKDLTENLQGLRKFKIDVEILFVHSSMATYKFTHKRRILKNYHYGFSDKGFDFYDNTGRVTDDNDFKFYNNYINIEEPLHYLKRFNQIKKNAENKIEKQGQNDRFFRLYREGSEADFVKNRLLQE